MSFCELHWKSQILGKAVTTWAIVPETGKGPFPVFYLLRRPHRLDAAHSHRMVCP